MVSETICNVIKNNINIISHELIKSRATNLPMKHIVKFLYGQIQKNIICYESILKWSCEIDIGSVESVWY